MTYSDASSRSLVDRGELILFLGLIDDDFTAFDRTAKFTVIFVVVMHSFRDETVDHRQHGHIRFIVRQTEW